MIRFALVVLCSLLLGNLGCAADTPRKMPGPANDEMAQFGMQRKDRTVLLPPPEACHPSGASIATFLRHLTELNLTQKALEKWKEMPLESARFEVVSAANDRVVLGWEATYRGNRVRSGELELDLDPHLPDCKEVGVFIDAGDDAGLALHGAAGDIHPRVTPGACDVAILVSRLPRELLLQATNPGHLLAYAHIEAPKNYLWLAAVPLAATADTVYAVLRFLLYNPHNPLRHPHPPPPPTHTPRWLEY